MKQIYLVILSLLFVTTIISAQEKVTHIDFVKADTGRWAETIYYYENNWQKARVTALAAGYISGYRILQLPSDTVADFNLLLITEFPSQEMYKKAEANFEPIIRTQNANGQKLLNELKPASFRKLLFSRQAHTILDSLN